MAEIVFESFFGDVPLNVAGMVPRVEIADIVESSIVKDVLRKGDVVTNMRVNGEPLPASPPTYEEFIKRIYEAGEKEWKVEFEVERGGGAAQWVGGAVPTVKIPNGGGKRGVGISPVTELGRPVIASTLDGTPAARSDLKRGARILKVDGAEVSNWFDVVAALRKSAAAGAATLTVADPSLAATQPVAATREVRMDFKDQDRQTLASIRYATRLLFRDRIEPRKTRNPLEAAGWGVEETRDMLLQFYVTIHRLTQGSVPASNIMGPLGIATAGSMFARKGTDWLIWFLAMISANLAVVNFLPIPIVDGGLFLFLILEKIMGRPLSPRMQTVAQLVGLALILSVFVFATYNDIARML
jgi:regulator of sigma E protease